MYLVEALARKKKEEKTTPAGEPLFVWKGEVYIWCRHQANSYHHTRKKIVSGVKRVLKRPMCFVCIFFTFYFNSLFFCCILD